MPRKPRQLTEAGVYHIVTRGNNRQKIFRRIVDFEYFLDLIRKMRAEYRFDLYHYCLMTNHIHLLIRFYDEESLQKVMQRINLRFAKYFRREYRYVGHVFQDRFRSFGIQKDNYLLECGRYIERNPLAAGMVKELSEYRWSSYAHYANGMKSDLLTDNPLYLDLSQLEDERKEKYRFYVLTERPYEEFIHEGILGNTRPSKNRY